uniref:Uncharacterized protein n=1 Tax=Sarcophilus harrisii TaxID=9305 RepID=A0A7N4NLS3_SARHA
MVHKNIPFLLKLLRCIVIINQSFTIKLKWPIETNSSETVLPPLIKTGVAGILQNIQLTQRRIIREALHTHRLAWNHVNDGSITRFQEFRAIFQLLTRTTINLLLQFSKLASNVSSVTIQNRCIACTDLAWMVQDNDLKKNGTLRQIKPISNPLNKLGLLLTI